MAGTGLTLPNAKKNFSIGLLAFLALRTPEFKTPLSYRTHVWGGVQLCFTRVHP
jgi:hypothetical protein